MLGNNGRSPIFPMWRTYPFWKDYEKYMAEKFEWSHIINELRCLHTVQRIGHCWHPAKEDRYDSFIFDAELEEDHRRKHQEQRHEMALKCVELGIYKDTYEANKDYRKDMLKNSNYKYKHLLYREQDAE